jgi:hypothetical protein
VNGTRTFEWRCPNCGRTWTLAVERGSPAERECVCDPQNEERDTTATEQPVAHQERGS